LLLVHPNKKKGDDSESKNKNEKDGLPSYQNRLFIFFVNFLFILQVLKTV